jgi:hypothetical protein
MILHFAPHALHVMFSVSYLHICARSRGAEVRNSIEQLRGVFEGPQALSCEDANIIVIKASAGAFN